MIQVEQTSKAEREKLEKDQRQKMEEFREKLVSELSIDQDEQEKKHAYRMQQARQEMEDRHDRVRSIF